ncbi:MULTISPECIES: Stk1 family PASTA domain-containing Ser/Thr kinase [unclassified Plantibacter]|uniref:Stk1 family PASTA domain-containing Ser/Thr kinase n=1 Tax=unclassified Plantibacter TaxID=2624265 RepID=UPI0007D93E95|nr:MULTISPECIES: Stk1 family PASTA domain-containing Ser/Thr kinase [unclassified Plantibacter]OAN27079.1 serine/threonine protein kinase [Plantibacter sp. H53]OII42489.1 serine/threonine protein kinase [Plantibacter sp. MMLR14_011]
MSSNQQTDPMIGRLLDGRYQVRSRIARGGMATVYLATDLRLERRVAIKVMHGHLSDDTTFKNRFIQEARSAARLANPHVVSVFDQGQDSDMAYLVMEHLPGITLRDLIRDNGTLTPRQAADILDAVLSGLAAAHRAGIVHRDVKPENVLLADDGRIKIGDFGLARAASANTATGQALLGTIAYLSPELVTRGQADARSDIYALGIMLYEMLTGEQPYKGEQPMQIAYQHANESVPAPSAKNPAVPKELDDLVFWATEREPDDRPSNAGEMLERLRSIESSLGFTSVATGAQPTIVMPASYSSEHADDVTQVIGRNTKPQQVPVRADATDGPGKLATKARKRSRVGVALFTIVLMLAALAGGTGWYFGQGPGSLVEVPNVADGSFDQASAKLVELGFVPVEGATFSLTVPAGTVAGSDPPSGSKIDKGSSVTVLVSQGPQPVDIPVLAGLAQSDAEQQLDALGVAVGTVNQQFDPSIAKDIVLAATDATSGADYSQGGPSFQGSTVTLLVSAGQVPSVSGMTPDQARDALESVGLGVGTSDEAFDDTIPAGQVIGIQAKTDADGNETAFIPGDDVTLIVSKGVELVAVPDTTGQTINQAITTLQDAGFTVGDIAVAEAFRDIFKVKKTDPPAGKSVKKGSTVNITDFGL